VNLIFFIFFIFGPREEGLLAPNRGNGHDGNHHHITVISAVLKLNLTYVDKLIYDILHLERKKNNLASPIKIIFNLCINYSCLWSKLIHFSFFIFLWRNLFKHDLILESSITPTP